MSAADGIAARCHQALKFAAGSRNTEHVMTQSWTLATWAQANRHAALIPRHGKRTHERCFAAEVVLRRYALAACR